MTLPFPDEYRGTLCHPDGRKSCGACCGVYNFTKSDPASTQARLLANSQAFDAGGEPIEFAKTHRVADSTKLLSGLQNCHFLGFLDRVQGVPTGRIGCLVHPTRIAGPDGRAWGVYDVDTCEDYLCAAHQLLREHEKWLVIDAIDDSYLYGLVLTDVRFVRELFERAADHLGESVGWDMLGGQGASKAARAYFELKIGWPYATHDSVFGQLRAGDDLDTPRREPPWAQLGVEPDPIDVALTCLGTQITSIAQLDAARGLAAQRITAFAEAVRR